MHLHWCACATPDSFGASAHCTTDKLREVEQLCATLGVHTDAAMVANVWVVPLYSWYHSSWDTQPDIPGAMAINKVRTIDQPTHDTLWLLHAVDDGLSPVPLARLHGGRGCPGAIL